MIIIHEGNPGAGKSYDAVRKIIDALKTGRVVYTNIDGLGNPGCLEVIATLTGQTRDSLGSLLFFLDRKDVPHFWTIAPPGSFVIIDEAQLFWSSRDSISGKNRDFCDWASTHRHHGYDLLLITQRAERIDTAVRSLSEFRYHYRKVNIFGSAISKQYMVYTYISDEKKSAFRPVRRTYQTEIFRCYQSYVGDVTEKAVFKAPNILKHPVFLLLAVVLAATVWSLSKSSLVTGDPLGYKAVMVKSGKVDSPGSVALIEGDGADLSAVPPSISVPAAVAVPAADSLHCLPFSAWVHSGGVDWVMVGEYRIKRFRSLDRDNRLVWVEYRDIPPPVRDLIL